MMIALVLRPVFVQVVMKVNGHVHTHDLKREFAEAMRAALANM